MSYTYIRTTAASTRSEGAGRPRRHAGRSARWASRRPRAGAPSSDGDALKRGRRTPRMACLGYSVEMMWGGSYHKRVVAESRGTERPAI